MQKSKQSKKSHKPPHTQIVKQAILTLIIITIWALALGIAYQTLARIGVPIPFPQWYILLIGFLLVFGLTYVQVAKRCKKVRNMNKVITKYSLLIPVMLLGNYFAANPDIINRMINSLLDYINTVIHRIK